MHLLSKALPCRFLPQPSAGLQEMSGGSPLRRLPLDLGNDSCTSHCPAGLLEPPGAQKEVNPGVPGDPRPL
ncbi:hypothetical protein FOCC_FOCC002853 [Frankliniella occidentalis]|nr:hypothetical protein FOCC_FOCC002853 [Frankliniella occidentalis]